MVATTVRAPHAADWALAHGRSALTTREVAELLDVPDGQVRQRLHAPARRGEWATPARGLWLPVPPEFRMWGAPPGIEVIDALASHLNVAYYVGWLSAAQMHGAAHQAPQVFQVAVSRHVPDRQLGRTRFRFQTRAHVGQVPVRLHRTRSGDVPYSTAAVTALDVAADVMVAGGIDNAATVVVELSETESFSMAELLETSRHYPRSTLRRIGWLLDNFGEDVDGLDALRDLALEGPVTPARLDPLKDLVGPHDERWNVRINRDVEPDL